MQKILMYLIGVTSLASFIVLFWNHWTCPEMVLPFEALRIIWLPSLPFFIFFASATFVGIYNHITAINFLIYFTPLLFFYGLFGFFGIKYTIISHNLFFFKANLLALLQLILASLIILVWKHLNQNYKAFKS